jgi:hypothetical protein
MWFMVFIVLVMCVCKLKSEIDDLEVKHTFEIEELQNEVRHLKKRLNYIEFGEEGVNHGLDN